MPHDQPWLDDYQARHQAELQARRDEENEVFRIQNQAMRATRECPLKLRTRTDCQNCGNEECVKAWKEQNKLWPEPYEEPAYRAGTTNTRQAAATSYAKSKLQNTQKSPHPGQPASGLTLFDLMIDDEKDKAA